MRLHIPVIFILLVAAGAAFGQQPRTLKAQYGNLEGAWLFSTDPSNVGETEGWQKPSFKEAGWRTLKVPGYWEPQGVTDPRPGQAPKPKNGLSYTDYDGTAWYRLHFVVPASWSGMELVLMLGSVDDEDRTFMNGTLVGTTTAVNGPSVSIQRRYIVPASLVKAGEENVLAIRVVDGGGPGGITGPFVTLMDREEADKMPTVPQSNRPLRERFAVPSADKRILKIIHSWPNSASDQQTLIRQLLGMGFGGVVCNDSFTDYLVNEDRWTDFERAVKSAKNSGMAMWLYDEKGYPSGSAGGLTIKGHPEYQAEGLLISDAESNGGTASLDVPPGTLMLAAAYPVKQGRIDLKSAVDLKLSVSNNKLNYTLPSGKWRVIVASLDKLYEGTHSSMSLGDKIPCINLLEHDPTARFLEVTHDQYAKHLGNDLGAYFKSTFTDEPSLMSMFLRRMPWRVLPWGPSFSGVFKKRRGYEIEPYLAALTADAGSKGAKARYDFWLTVGEMVSENYFGQIKDWCKAHNLLSGGHLLYEEPILYHVPLYGDLFRCARNLSAPSIDCLTSVPSEVPWYIARLLSSAGDLEGHALTMCETSDFAQVYRTATDTRPVRQVTEEEIRGTCNRLMLGGINTITSYYTFQGIELESMRRLNEWVGRCCESLRGGHQATDVALVYPIESIWPRFEPTHAGPTNSPSANQVDSDYRYAIETLYASGRDFTFIDARTLVAGKVANGRLTCSGMSWRVIVLPCVDTLPIAAWENLAKFVKSGGVVVSLGDKPANSESEFPSHRVKTIADELFGGLKEAGVSANASGGGVVWLPVGSETLLASAMNQVVVKDLIPSETISPIRYTHKRIDGHEVYFVINDSGSPWKGTATLAVTDGGEEWDPATGDIKPLESGRDLVLDLPAYGAMIFRFERAQLPIQHKLKSGLLAGLSYSDMPVVKPIIGAGQYVKSVLENTGSGWKATGTLTKSNTDTYLFLSYRYPSLVNLSGLNGLALSTQVPDGQTTSPNMVVIIHEKDGGDYIANTGRSLTAPGTTQSIIPWSRFDLAGWSKDANGRLDLDKIETINVGWGGYLGTEGERVEFTLRSLKTVKLP